MYIFLGKQKFPFDHAYSGMMKGVQLYNIAYNRQFDGEILSVRKGEHHNLQQYTIDL